MTVDAIMEKVCDCCRWPYSKRDETAMQLRCAACGIETNIRDAIEKAELKATAGTAMKLSTAMVTALMETRSTGR